MWQSYRISAITTRNGYRKYCKRIRVGRWRYAGCGSHVGLVARRALYQCGLGVRNPDEGLRYAFTISN